MSVDLPEKRLHLWGLAAAPALWALHLLLSYGTAAVYCAKFAAVNGSLAAVRIAIGAYTAAALGGVLLIGKHALRRHRFGDSTLPHDFDSRADRHRFLGFATLLLAGLSAIAIVFAALTVVFIRSCR
jgi:hypothetical protein